MRLFRVVLVVLCLTAAGLLVPAGPANATAVLQPPTLTKSFLSSSIPLNGTTIMHFEFTNPNATALTGVTVTDTLPAGLVVPNAPFGESSCGGTWSTTPTSVSITGWTLPPTTPPPPDVTCGLDLLVRGTTLGPKVNTTSPVTSTNGGTGAPATATLLVANQPPTLTKSFSPSSVAVGATRFA